MSTKTFAIIGMGRFGSSVAKALYEMGYDVMAIDSSEERIQEHIQYVTYAVQADSTDEKAMKELGIRNFDTVVVAIGADIHSSILTTLILRELGVKNITVKAQNERHGKVLYKVGADKVVFPERDMGNRVAHNLVSPNVLDFIELAEDYSVVEIVAGDRMDGKSLAELNIRAKFGFNVIAIKRGAEINIAPRAEDTILTDDILVVVGENSDLKRFEREIV
ncbi:potassium channel family protein [Ammoniphilus resinae]|uniref:Trk system potassium uptake protein TrkA n=1 Tax=Ammoniphilus resinae TaxID=861532 RepID=A0ABS4GXB0_9BACL|nr:TrkA family potassium uptake protein [Ammoniphilus resinae]MBP1934908.1 trk system potassium uptake protein TrkA [Ammoniphilus resinae]